MKLSLSTNWCNRRMESGEEIADKALELGFDELELGFHTTQFQVAGFRRRLDRIPVGSVHAFCPVPISAPQGYPELYALASHSADARAIARVHVRKNIEFAADIGADTVVLHAGRVTFSGLFRVMDSPLLRATLKACDNEPDDPRYRSLLKRAMRRREENGAKMLKRGRFVQMLKSLVPDLERRHVTLALENLPYLEGFPNENETAAILREFAGAPIRAWFDTGHHRVRESYGWVSPESPLMNGAFAETILGEGRQGPFAGMHVNDVERFEDDHYAPGRGNVDFKALTPLAKSVRHVVFEPNAGVSEDDLAAGLRLIRSLWDA